MGSRSDRDDLARKLFDERFSARAKHYGDADAKKDTAAARRLATALRKAADTFGSYLPAADAKTLVDAAQVMEALARSTVGAASLAATAQANQRLEAQQAREARAEQVAAELWGAGDAIDRPTMLSDCRALVEFFDLAPLPSGSAAWMEAHRPERHASLEDLAGGHHGPLLIELLQAYEEHPGPHFFASLRRRAAEYMDALRRSRPGAWHGGAVLDDFEAWRASHPKLPPAPR